MTAPVTVPHVFLTRFNVPTNRVESSIYSPEWLTNRIALFEKYTLPSVRAQAAEGRHWLVYCGIDSPEWLRAYMTRLTDAGLLTALYITGPLSEAQIRRDVADAIGRQGGPVTTSNLDNDDGLAADYLTRVRSVEPREAHALLVLDEGLILSAGRAYFRVDVHNAFSAVLTDVGSAEFRSCWAEWHNRLHLVLPAYHVRGGPAWLQVVHGVNVSNRVRGRLTTPDPHVSRFGALLDGVQTPPGSQVVMDRVVFGPARDAKDAGRTRAARLARATMGQQRYDSMKYHLLRGLARFRPSATPHAGHAGERR